jgi:dienelactone hydrolase
MAPHLEFDETITRRGAARCEFLLVGGPREVPGVLWLPEISPGSGPVVAFGHGASGDRHQAPIPRLARRLVRETGGVAVAIDGPVHGRRRVGDGGRGAFWAAWTREETVDEFIEDWRAVIDAVLALGRVGARPVGYWGLSMGTILGLPLVAAEPRVDAAVLGLMGDVGPTPAYRARLAEDAARIDLPVRFLVQLEDELFDRAACLALFDRLGSEDKALHAHPGRHPEVPLEALDASLDFLVERLALARAAGDAPPA